MHESVILQLHPACCHRVSVRDLKAVRAVDGQDGGTWADTDP